MTKHTLRNAAIVIPTTALLTFGGFTASFAAEMPSSSPTATTSSQDVAMPTLAKGKVASAVTAESTDASWNANEIQEVQDIFDALNKKRASEGQNPVKFNLTVAQADQSSMQKNQQEYLKNPDNFTTADYATDKYPAGFTTHSSDASLVSNVSELLESPDVFKNVPADATHVGITVQDIAKDNPQGWNPGMLYSITSLAYPQAEVSGTYDTPTKALQASDAAAKEGDMEYPEKSAYADKATVKSGESLTVPLTDNDELAGRTVKDLKLGTKDGKNLDVQKMFRQGVLKVAGNSVQVNTVDGADGTISTYAFVTLNNNAKYMTPLDIEVTPGDGDTATPDPSNGEGDKDGKDLGSTPPNNGGGDANQDPATPAAPPATGGTNRGGSTSTPGAGNKEGSAASDGMTLDSNIPQPSRNGSSQSLKGGDSTQQSAGTSVEPSKDNETCDEIRDRLGAPGQRFKEGQKGYSASRDRDHDGYACDDGVDAPDAAKNAESVSYTASGGDFGNSNGELADTGVHRTSLYAAFTGGLMALAGALGLARRKGLASKS